MRRNPRRILPVCLASFLAVASVTGADHLDSAASAQESGTGGLIAPLTSVASGAAVYRVVATRHHETHGHGSATHIAWSRAPARRPARVSAFVKRRGESSVRVNPKGTLGFAGDIDGNLMIYQQVRRGQSDIKVFNLRRRARRKAPSPINTRKWEWKPSLSGRRILFGRLNKRPGPDVEKIMLYDSVSERMLTLARRWTPTEAVPGQVNGDWVTYYLCPGKFACRTFRYNAATRKKEKFPSENGPVYAPSVLEDGTAYFVRSAPRCGVGVRLIERTVEGVEREIFRLDRGWDISTTSAFIGPDGNPKVYFDLTNCRATVTNVYGVDIPAKPSAPEPTPTGTASPTPTSSPTSGPGPDTDLPTLASSIAYQADPSHSGVLEGVGLSPALRTRWTRDFGQQLSYPVIADGMAFVIVRNASDYGTSVHALDLETGRTLWEKGIGGTYYWANATYEAGRLFVQNFDGMLLALDAVTGATVWVTELADQYAFSSPPVAHDHVVYTGGGGSGGTVYAVDATSGDVLWRHSLSSGSHSSPALSHERLFVSYSCPNVYALERVTGLRLWEYTPGCSGGGGRTAVYDAGKLYVRDGTEGFVFESDSGQLIDAFGASAAPAADDGEAYFVFRGALEARSASGTLRWTFTPSEQLVSAPLLVDGYVYVGSIEGSLYVLRASDGLLLGEHALGGPVAHPDEHNVSRPLTGLGAGEGLLLVPHGTSLTALGN